MLKGLSSLLLTLVATIATGLSCMTARADQVEIGASRDNTVIQDALGLLSGGASPYVFCGRTNGGEENDIRRALIRFDIASAVPPGSTVTSVTLRMRMSRSVNSGPNPCALHRMLADWGEGTSTTSGGGGGGNLATPNDVTWLHSFYDTTFWSTPGGEFDPAISAVTTVDGIAFYEWSSPQMAADVQAWLDVPSTNFGWMLRGNESTAPTSKRFDSRNHGTPANRPKLTIIFTPPSAVGACCLPNDVCTLTTAAQCATQGGTYQGDGTSCDSAPCGSTPVGACCLSNGACMVTSESKCLAQGGTYQGDDVGCADAQCPVALEPFVDPLPVLAVMQPMAGQAGGEATYQIFVREFTQQLHRDLPPTRLWGYNGSYPGATIEASVAEPVTVQWISDIRDANGDLRATHFLPVDECLHGPDMFGPTPRTVVHLHGGCVPPEADGHPEDTILPGESQSFIYPNEQLPATLWYHDHALGITRLNVYMGLAGFYLLRDDFERNLPLPAGEYEIPLAIQDRSFNADGSLRYPATWQEDFYGDTMLVNGKVWPYLNVKQSKYRFRVLNGCNSRTLTLRLSNNQTFQQIGSDGGLFARPVALTQLTIMPGERADVIVDFASLPLGETVTLLNSAPAPYPGEAGVGVIPNVMQFRVQDSGGFTAPLPPRLRPLETLDLAQVRRSRDFTLRMAEDPCTGMKWLINDLMWHDIVEFPQLGQTEIWRFINRSDMSHPMHLHLVQFQVLDRQAFTVVNGEVVPQGSPVPPDANEVGWKDTVRVDPNMIVRVIARFDGYTGRFPYHCHILEHEDHEMMRQFEVRAACPADVSPAPDGDRVVDVDDLMAVILSWGRCPAPCSADVVLNGAVDVDDLIAVILAWGECPDE